MAENRQIDDDSLQEIAKREGLRLLAYKDSGGTWTIGYGHTEGVKAGDVITDAQALAYLKSDLGVAEDCVSSTVTVSLSDSQYGALVSFCFNIGCAAFSSSTLLKNLNKGDYAGVPAQMLQWVKVNKIVDQGLVNRRNSEGGQWVKNAYVRGAAITPDSPPPLWRRVWQLGHVKVKAAGASIGAMGIGSAQLKTVGSEIQALSPMLMSLGIGIVFIGIIMELFHKEG